MEQRATKEGDKGGAKHGEGGRMTSPEGTNGNETGVAAETGAGTEAQPRPGQGQESQPRPGQGQESQETGAGTGVAAETGGGDRGRGRDRNCDRGRDRGGDRGGDDETKRGNVTALRQTICVGFCNRLAQRLPKHNGFRTLNDNAVLAEVHPSSARPLANEITGLLPEWIVYHELVATTRAFLRNVCAVEAPWVAPVTERLREVDLKRLSGGRVATRKAREEARRERAKEAERQRIESGARRNDDKTVDDARARALARKAAAEKAKKVTVFLSV